MSYTKFWKVFSALHVSFPIFTSQRHIRCHPSIPGNSALNFGDATGDVSVMLG